VARNRNDSARDSCYADVGTIGFMWWVEMVSYQGFKQTEVIEKWPRTPGHSEGGRDEAAKQLVCWSEPDQKQ
jgi:hypothetical protein